MNNVCLKLNVQSNLRIQIKEFKTRHDGLVTKQDLQGAVFRIELGQERLEKTLTKAQVTNLLIMLGIWFAGMMCLLGGLVGLAKLLGVF